MHKHTKGKDTAIISFGNFGGFTGGKVEYIIKNNGEVSAVTSSSHDTTLIKTMSIEDTKFTFDCMASEKLNTINLKEAGNMNYYIIYYKNGVLTREYSWTDNSTVPEDLRKLYAILLNHIK